MRKKTVLFAGLLLCVIVVGVGFYLYNKPRTSAADRHTDDQVTAKELYRAFAADEPTANKLYANKVLEVSGNVLQVQQTGKDISVLLEGGSKDSGGVNCTIATGAPVTAPKVGSTLHIKGMCTGFLMDVSLVDATIVNNN
jgi:hypothetical protein